MAKVIFEYDKNENKNELDMHLQAEAMHYTIYDLDNYFIQMVKYNQESSEMDHDTKQKIREHLLELINKTTLK